MERLGTAFVTLLGLAGAGFLVVGWFTEQEWMYGAAVAAGLVYYGIKWWTQRHQDDGPSPT
jgi:hypothetical protein